jgi:hypothetical protein
MVINGGIMKIIQAGKFKAQCLALLDSVANSHIPLLITKHGKPVAKQDINIEKPLKGSVVFIGDVISPIDENWDALK